MIFKVELRKCRYPLHDIDITHLWPPPSMEVEEGPLVVKLLDNGEYFVEDGRHRAIRALLRGETLHDAIWYDDWIADIETARLREALHGSIDKPTAEPVTRNPIVLHTTTHSAYDVRHSGPLPQWLNALANVIHKAACGRALLHDPHAFGEHMEEFCSGQPRLRRAFCGKTYEHNPHVATFDDPNPPAFRCDGLPK